jgi:DNA-binding CsgD family transcriptional regulator/tetratricopeptide (TPR) repeat protein
MPDNEYMPLLERESQLASLREYASEAGQGHGRLVLVAGEAGAGKSALVERLEQELPEARWSWGACDGLFTPRPLGPLFDLAPRLGGELAGLCRTGAAREDLFGALLRQVSAPQRVLNVIVIEDIHWADEATIDLLRFLGRRLRDVPLMLIVTYRDDGVAAGDPLRVALGDVASLRSTRRVRLAPLSAAAVQVLAGGTGLEAAALYRLTGGNPFYVTEVMRAGLSVVPASARDAVLARVARLRDGSRHVLDAAALIGARVELGLLRLVTACAPPAVDELLASGLLTEDGVRLRFRHEIARLAVEQSVAAHRRVAIHAQILRSLRELGCDDDARIAFHAEAADDGPTVWRHAPGAARRAAELSSHREAVAQYERALRFAPDTDTDTDTALAAALYDELATELSLIDHCEESADATRHALALWRSAGNRLREGDSMLRLACSLAQLCLGPEAGAAGEGALAILEPLGPTIELARAYATLSAHRMVAYDHDVAIELALRAQQIAEPLGAFEVLSNALNNQGCAAALKGDPWTDYLGRALRIALTEGLHEQAGRAYSNLYNVHAGLRQFAAAERYFTEGTAYCDEHDLVNYATYLRGEHAMALQRTGHWDQAVRLSAELLAGAGTSPLNRLGPLYLLGLIRSRRDEPGVWEYLDEAATAADRTDQPQWIVPVRLARAEAYWLQGDTHQARAEAELADDVSGRCNSWERGEIGIWLLRTMSARTPGGPVAEPFRLQIEGQREQAARSWAELGCPYEAALALCDGSDQESLRRALALLQDLGATAAARIARQTMRTAGMRSIPVGPRTATRVHPAGLTPREHEVLDLICSGHTNAQIAERLFISAKTVGHHVSAILAKLDAPTRTVAASEAVRRGLVGATPSLSGPL